MAKYLTSNTNRNITSETIAAYSNKELTERIVKGKVYIIK